MPQRAVNLLLALAGVAAVVLLMVLGVDLARSAGRGPRWKRRLVGAGILLLTSLGFAPAGCQEQMRTPAEAAATLEADTGEKAKADSTAAPEPATLYREPKRDLAQEIMLEDYTAARSEAEDILLARPGDSLFGSTTDLPWIRFRETDKKDLLEQLTQAQQDAEQLLKAGCLTESEAMLMQHDLKALTVGIEAKAPIPGEGGPATTAPLSAISRRLADRLPFIEKVDSAKTFHENLLWPLLQSTDRDVRALNDDALKPMPAKDRGEALQIRKQTESLLVRIHERMGQAKAVPPNATLPAIVRMEVLTRRLEAIARWPEGHACSPDILETLTEAHRQFAGLKEEFSGEIKAIDPLYERAQDALGKVYTILANSFAKPEPIKTCTVQELKGQTLEEAQAWKDLVRVWKEAADIASGTRGKYPFHERWRSGFFANMEVVTENVCRMQEAGLLSQPEAELLRLSMKTLLGNLRGFRAKEEIWWTCYVPLQVNAAEISLKSLSERLPLLEKLAAENRVPQAVVEKCLYSIENDLKILSNEKELEQLGVIKQVEAKKTRQTVEALVKKIRANLAPQEGRK